MMANPTPTPGKAVRDVGSGEPLPYGEATALNENLEMGDAVEEQIQDTAIMPPGQTMLPTQDDGEIDYGEGYDEYGYRPNGGMEEVLFGPTDGLGRNQMRQGNKPVPNSVIRALPMLSAIVNDPTTPPAIKAAYATVLRMLEAEQENR